MRAMALMRRSRLSYQRWHRICCLVARDLNSLERIPLELGDHLALMYMLVFGSSALTRLTVEREAEFD